MSLGPSAPSPAGLPHRRPRSSLLQKFTLIMVLAALGSTLLAGEAAAATTRPVHVKVRGHIVYLSPARLKVRDRRGLVHVVLLTPTTTYWHKLDPRSYHDLAMAMRVYILGLPNPDGTVTALKVHIYYPRGHKATRRRSTP